MIHQSNGLSSKHYLLRATVSILKTIRMPMLWLIFEQDDPILPKAMLSHIKRAAFLYHNCLSYFYASMEELWRRNRRACACAEQLSDLDFG